MLTFFGSMPGSSFFSFSFMLLIHEGSHREVYGDFQPSLTSSAGGAKGCSDTCSVQPPSNTAQLLTLLQHRANNQYRTRLIKSSRQQHSSNTWTRVSHLSTNRAQRCLTSVTVQELVFPNWYAAAPPSSSSCTVHKCYTMYDEVVQMMQMGQKWQRCVVANWDGCHNIFFRRRQTYLLQCNSLTCQPCVELLWDWLL